MKGKNFGTLYLLQLVLGISLIVFGIMAINGYNSAGQEAIRGLNKMLGKSGNLFPIIFGVLQLVAGIVLVAELFVPLPGRLFPTVHIAICIFWLINIILQYILSNFMEPDILRWLGALAPQLVILLSLWLLRDEF